MRFITQEEIKYITTVSQKPDEMRWKYINSAVNYIRKLLSHHFKVDDEKLKMYTRNPKT